jgi:hypothetical protein
MDEVGPPAEPVAVPITKAAALLSGKGAYSKFVYIM